MGCLGVKIVVPNPADPILSPQVDSFTHLSQITLNGGATLSGSGTSGGTVGEVYVAHSSGHTVLDTAAQAAARTWKHEPATQDGTPVTRWAELNLAFHLDKAQSAGGTKQP
jgi:TonB family protein